jgi:hypothetical protein
MGAVPNSFMQNILSQIRAPITAQNIANLQTWRRFEGGTAVNNPLNTTEPAPGSTDYNDAGVQNYPSAAIGERMTAETLMNGRYTAILVKLQHSAPLPLWNDPSVLEQIDVWGSVGFADYIRKLAPPAPAPKPPIVLEDEPMKVVRVPNGTAYLLGGSFMIPISDGPTEQKWLMAGCELVDLSANDPGDAEMYNRLIAQFPPKP